MSKVEMSLSEYNSIKEELDLLRQVIEELTTPVIDEWDYEYHMKNRDYYRVPTSISSRVRTYLESQVMNHIPNGFIDKDFIEGMQAKFENPVVLEVYYKNNDNQEDELKGE